MRRSFILTSLFLLVLGSRVHAQLVPANIPDITFATVKGRALKLDLYYPAHGEAPWPVIIWIHGGGWRGGDRYSPEAEVLTQAGYVVASISYRLSTVARFPAQIHDCKAAVRWLRSNALRLMLDANAIGVWGNSSGGHLAMLLGTSAGVADLEGAVGGNLAASSHVQAVCSFFGHGNFITMLDYPHGIDRRKPSCSIAQLLGTMIAQDSARARHASPITYISMDDPPFLLMHGTADRIVPYQQSVEFDAALRAQGVKSTLRLLPGEGHGSRAFYSSRIMEEVRDFFDRELGMGPAMVAGPLPRRLEVRCVPNPAIDALTLTIGTPAAGVVDIDVQNALGATVQEHRLECLIPGRYVLRLDIEHWPRGHYSIVARRGWAVDIEHVTVVH